MASIGGSSLPAGFNLEPIPSSIAPSGISVSCISPSRTMNAFIATTLPCLRVVRTRSPPEPSDHRRLDHLVALWGHRVIPDLDEVVAVGEHVHEERLDTPAQLARVLCAGARDVAHVG